MSQKLRNVLFWPVLVIGSICTVAVYLAMPWLASQIMPVYCVNLLFGVPLVVLALAWCYGRLRGGNDA